MGSSFGQKNDVLILGAGPAGMAAAFELGNALRRATIVEKNDRVGGLARTLQYGAFRTDIGPHRFFSQNPRLYDIIGGLLGPRWIKVNRLTRFYINGKFILYPVEWKNALTQVGFRRALRILFDYAYEKMRGTIAKREIRSFEDYCVAIFGRALAELNMLNYTEKIWGLPCSELSADWARQRIRGLSLSAMLKKMVRGSAKGPKTLVDQFYYPDEGTGLIYEEMKERALRAGSVLMLNSYPVKVVHDGSTLKEVIVSSEGATRTIAPGPVLSSIPITEFIKLLEPKAPHDVIEAAGHLRFRAHVALFITLTRPSAFPDQWIYFPDREIPFGRVMEPKNFSAKMSPRDKTSLLIEFFCGEGDAVWNADREKLFGMSAGWLEKLGFIKREEVIDMFVHRERYAYPVYDLSYKENLGRIKDYLNGFGNLFLIGRSGAFRYNSQDQALEMGILAARSVIEEKRYDIEGVGIEQEYIERGYIR